MHSIAHPHLHTQASSVVSLKDQAFVLLACVGCLWVALSCVTVLRRLAALRATNRTCAAVRDLLGIPNQVCSAGMVEPFKGGWNGSEGAPVVRSVKTGKMALASAIPQVYVSK